MAKFSFLAVLLPLLISLTSAQLICAAVVTATVPFEAALSAHATGAACPTAYYQLEINKGFCCANTAQPRTVSGTVGCCACGVFCTGDFVAASTWGNHAIGPETLTTTQVVTGSSVTSTITQTVSTSATIPSTTANPSVSTTNPLGSSSIISATPSTTQIVATTTGPSTTGTTTRAASGTTSSASMQSSSAARAGNRIQDSLSGHGWLGILAGLLAVFEWA